MRSFQKSSFAGFGKMKQGRKGFSKLSVEMLEPRVVLDGAPVISEFLAVNDTVLEDQDGDDSDWIEVLNPTSETISLNKFALTDDTTDLAKWRFPDILLNPGEHVVVFASGKDRDNPLQELHTNFKLSSSGEYLALVQPDGETVVSEFSQTFPQQVKDVSYGLPTGVRNSRVVVGGANARYWIPTDNTLDPTEPDAISGTWLDPAFEDASWSQAATGIGYVPGESFAVLADSVADFSGVQGQHNWTYGTWAKSIDFDKIYKSNEFVEMNAATAWRADTNKWDLLVDNPPNLELTATGGHPSTTSAGFFTQWAIRRWTSETVGEVTIEGTLSNPDPAGDGVVGHILVNGAAVYSKLVNGSEDNFSFTTNLELGDLVDFAIDAGESDEETGDDTTFTAQISGNVFVEHPTVVLADSTADWVNETQGNNGWSYGYFDETADANGIFESKDFVEFPPEFWARNKWDWPNGNPPYTQIGKTATLTSGLDEGDVVHWAIRRWTSTWDGPISVNWSLSKSRTGGDGATGRVLLNGNEIDSFTIAANNRTGVTRTVDIENISHGDVIDIALDPLGMDADPANKLSDDDNSNMSIQISRIANLEIDVASDIGAEMKDVSASLYARIPFAVEDVTSLAYMNLGMKYDAGFTAFLNGQPIADANSPAMLGFDSQATEGRDPVDATTVEVFDVTSSLDLLVSGENVLQIHGLNESKTNENFLLVPELEIGIQTVEKELKRFFVSPTPGESNGLGSSRIGPLVVDVTHTPSVPSINESILVTAQIAETFTPIGSAKLHYRVMYEDTTTVDMIDDGTGPDAQANDGLYSALIPGGIAEPGQMIRWSVTSNDTEGVNSRFPVFSDTRNDEEFLGTVVDDPTIVSNLPVFHWFIENPRRATNDAGTTASFFYDGEFYDNVRFSLHGQSSKGFPAGGDRGRQFETAKSYNVGFPNSHRFRLEEDILRFDGFNLLTNYADQSLLRNTLAWEQIAATGAPALMAFPVRLHQNGEFFSIHDFVEDADNRWLDRMELDPEGALYKMYTSFSPSGNEKKTRKDEGIEDLREVITGIRNLEYVYDNVDIPAMVNFLVGFPMNSDRDCCHKNYYAYRDTNGTGEWSFFHWDTDLTNGRNWGGFGRAYFDDTIYFNNALNVGGNNSMVTAVNRLPGFKSMFERRLRTMLDEYVKAPGTPYEQLVLENRVDELYELMKDDAALHNERNPTNWGQDRFRDFKTSIDLIKDAYSAPRREWIFQNHVVSDDSGAVKFFDGSPGKSQLEYLIPTDNSLGTTWTTLDFDAANWTQGTGGIGFETRGSDYRPLLGTDIESEMVNRTSVYARFPFTVESLADVENLILRMKYDDGFVAYLNGVEIARDRVPDGVVGFDAEATRSHADRFAVQFENFDVSEHLNLLKIGENMLAIHGLNTSPTNNDMLIQPELSHGTIIEGNGTIPSSQVGNPKIDFGDIEHRPASTNQAEEYIQLVNNNGEAVDMSGWSLTGDVSFTFKGGTVLPAGFTMYVTADKRAFLQRSEGPSGGMSLFTVGNYEGELSNVAGSVSLVAEDGEVVNTATFSGEASNVQDFLRISEINYNPLEPSVAEKSQNIALDNDDFEFVELVNTSTTETLNLAGVRFTEGIQFDFSGQQITSLAPGERILVVKDASAFALRYDQAAVDRIAGEFVAGSGLANDRDNLRLVDPGNSVVAEFTISANPDQSWPDRADGNGSSLEVVDLNGDYDDPANWRASSRIHGTAGGSPEFLDGDPDRPIITGVVINEVLANSGPTSDAIELHNISADTLSLSNYYLSDSARSVDSFSAYAIPATDLPAGGFLVLDESQFNSGENGFGLNGDRGDEIYLTVGNETGPTHFADSISFAASEEGSTYGRIEDGWLVPLESMTLGETNSAHRASNVIISEVHYHPAEASAEAIALYSDLDSNDLEFLEIHNQSSEVVSLENWRIRGGVDYDFATGASIGAGETLVITSFDPSLAGNTDRLAAFKTQYSIGDSTMIVGGYSNSLNNAGDRVTLQRPGTPDGDDPAFIPRLTEDAVIYRDRGAWPIEADGMGSSLSRTATTNVGLDPASWSARQPVPGIVDTVSPDINKDGLVDEADIQLVCSGFLANNPTFDFDRNEELNLDDFVFYIVNILNTDIGDSNLDGKFTSRDFVSIFIVGEYEDGVAENSTWSEGDWNCSGDFDTSDLVFAFEHGGFSSEAVADGSTDVAGALHDGELDPMNPGSAADETDSVSDTDVIAPPLLDQQTVDLVFAERKDDVVIKNEKPIELEEADSWDSLL